MSSKGASKTGSKPERGMGPKPPTPSQRTRMPPAMAERFANARDFNMQPYKKPTMTKSRRRAMQKEAKEAREKD